MKTIASFLLALHKDEDGASFIEYTALLGVILAVGIGVLTAVGLWADGVWDALCTQLGTGCTDNNT
jgi:Flp pilus assembly pilin Flp